MRFRFSLPLLQTTAMLIIIWAPWEPKAHELVVRLANGAERKIWTLIPGPPAVDWALGINLPSAAIITPVEFAIRKTDPFPSYKVSFYGFWLVGLFCWYMVGRCADDVVLWRRSRVLPRKRIGDLAFALIAVPSAALLAAAFTFGDLGVPVLAVWGVIWVVATCAALVFRVFQFVLQRHNLAAA